MQSSTKSKRERKRLVGWLIFVGTSLTALVIFLTTRKAKAKETKSSPGTLNAPKIPGTLNAVDLEPLFRRSGSPWVGTKYDKTDYRRWMEAMAKHETGGYKSALFQNHKNLFGMGVAQERSTLGKPSGMFVEGMERAAFDSYSDSIQDLILWMDYMNFPTNLVGPDGFVNALKSKGYFTDSADNYLKGMERWL